MSAHQATSPSPCQGCLALLHWHWHWHSRLEHLCGSVALATPLSPAVTRAAIHCIDISCRTMSRLLLLLMLRCVSVSGSRMTHQRRRMTAATALLNPARRQRHQRARMTSGRSPQQQQHLRRRAGRASSSSGNSRRKQPGQQAGTGRAGSCARVWAG